MVVEIEGDNVPHALEEALIKMPIYSVQEASRNGPVLTIPEPVVVTIHRPWERVIVDERRNANPFFHLAEFVWMMGGSNDVRFIEQYNPRMREYADPGSNVHHGAYGFRWRYHFGRDQLVHLSQMLREDPGTRRAVLGMWDPTCDLAEHNDLPCNTHIYFRVIKDRLDMTVCNRSNDLLWGSLGANAVHMTLLHELMARSVGIRQGIYRVFTNNLHIYTERKDYQRMLKAPPLRDDYVGLGKMKSDFPVLHSSESLADFLEDCYRWLRGNELCKTRWMNGVFFPVMRMWSNQKLVEDIKASDWKLACTEWLARRQASK